MRRIFLILAATIGVAFSSYSFYMFNIIDKRTPEQLYKDGLEALEFKDYKSAFELFAEAADEGYPDAIFKVADLYYSGLGVEKNIPKAVELIKYGAENGHPMSCAVLGDWYIYGFSQENVKIEPDEERALYYLTIGAKNGNSLAQWELGDLYFAGKGVKADPVEAFKWYLKSSGQDDPTGLKRVGEGYLDGYVVAKDLDKAEEYLLKAKKLGAQDVDILLAEVSYARQDYATALRILNGLPEDTETLRLKGSCNARIAAQNGSQDYSTAVKYWEQAAQDHDPLAMYYTAISYYEGLGVEKDLYKSVDLFTQMFEDINWELKPDTPNRHIYGIASKLMSNCFRYGRGGVEQNAEMSDALNNIAKQLGCEDVTIREIIETLTK